MKRWFLLLLLPLQLYSQNFTRNEMQRWQNQAARVSIVRDNWGIPHVYGKSDADAVFGLLYAQCEDDFNRVEMNYIEKLGRLAEIHGEKEFYNDLLTRLVIDSSDAIRDYQRAPAWLKKLCLAFADGINYFLYKNPSVKPVLLTRFQPWYPLLWTDGSIGAINTADITVKDLENLYGKTQNNTTFITDKEEMLTGSNGFAFAPSITASGNAILYINPHVTFYFRPEVHMVSEEGLNAYGAVTWGQFFVYQGFNEHCGWMHTSSYADAADSYIEKISPKGNGFVYEYDHIQKPVVQKKITIRYKSHTGISSKTIEAWFTGHGPVMAKRNGQYLSLRADNRLMNGLIQCWQRTKAKGLADFKKSLDLLGNISNNTVYADADGNIAYWHANRIPKKNPDFDWSRPVDGTTRATEWQGIHAVDETVHILNPPNGWIQNCNSTPFTSAGPYSPKKNNYPRYMAPDGENFRGINAVRVLGEGSRYDIDKAIRAGYDTRLAAFEVLVPALVKAFEKNVAFTDSLYPYLLGPVTLLKNWDFRCGEESVATTLAVEWGTRLLPAIFRTKVVEDEEDDQVSRTKRFTETASAKELIDPLLDVIHALERNYGRWQVGWGTINRFQRISGDIDQTYSDQEASLPVGFASSTWGMLPSYTSRYYPGTHKRYGVNGNSFICAVEFGKKIKAKSLLAGGESGHPSSAHFFDQGEMYAKGIFKDVYFYQEDVMKHVERMYHPGE